MQLNLCAKSSIEYLVLRGNKSNLIAKATNKSEDNNKYKTQSTTIEKQIERSPERNRVEPQLEMKSKVQNETKRQVSLGISKSRAEQSKEQRVGG